jgi:hypothetical protein
MAAAVFSRFCAICGGVFAKKITAAPPAAKTDGGWARLQPGQPCRQSGRRLDSLPKKPMAAGPAVHPTIKVIGGRGPIRPL